MGPSDALSTGAQIAVTLAGFTGIVAVFGSSAPLESRSVHLFRLRVLVTFSVIPLLLCMLGLLLLTTEMSAPLIWRWCSGIAAVPLLAAGIWVVMTLLRLPAGEFKAAGGSFARSGALSVLGTLVSLLQIYNAAVLAQFWPFFAAVVTTMLAALIQFVLMVSHKRGSVRTEV